MSRRPWTWGAGAHKVSLDYLYSTLGVVMMSILVHQFHLTTGNICLIEEGISVPDRSLSGTGTASSLSGNADQLAVDELLNTQEGQFAAKA